MSVEINNKSDRAELKTYFARNAIPTEANFAALIDGVVNQREDGVAIPVGGPLSLRSTNDGSVLDMYEDFDQATPSWTIGLSVGDGGNRRHGLSVSSMPIPGSGSGPLKLFLGLTGNVGIGTDDPQHKLDVAGSVRVNSGHNPLHFTSDWSNLSSDTGAEISNDTNRFKTLMILGNRSAGNERRVSVWDRLEVHGTLQTHGNVGIGTATPSDPLDVAGRVRVNSNRNPLHFTSNWSGFPDRRTDTAEISNDTSGFKTLMIVGNKSAGLKRRVSVWDRLEVNGTLHVTQLENWRGVSFRNGWRRYSTAYANPSYYKDPFGIVHLTGLIKDGAAGQLLAFTLPSGFRPRIRQLFTSHSAGVAGTSRPVARVDVLTNGNVEIRAANHGWVSLYGFSFRTTG